jgi:hypothetical protein
MSFAVLLLNLLGLAWGSRIGKSKEKQRGHIDRCIDISIPSLFMDTTIAVGALQYDMVVWLERRMSRRGGGDGCG